MDVNACTHALGHSAHAIKLKHLAAANPLAERPRLGSLDQFRTERID